MVASPSAVILFVKVLPPSVEIDSPLLVATKMLPFESTITLLT